MSYENAFMQNDNRKIALEETALLKFHISERSWRRDGGAYVGNMNLMQDFSALLNEDLWYLKK